MDEIGDGQTRAGLWRAPFFGFLRLERPWDISTIFSTWSPPLFLSAVGTLAGDNEPAPARLEFSSKVTVPHVSELLIRTHHA